MTQRLRAMGFAVVFGAAACSARGDVLTGPQWAKGGGGGGMVMPQPYLLANQVVVDFDYGGSDPGYKPVLTGEPPGNTFVGTWSLLNGQAYNMEYGWDNAAWNFHDDQYVWIELLSHTPGLATYGDEAVTLFQNDGDQWNFSGGMVHNVYAIPAQQRDDVFATYRVFVGGPTGIPDLTIIPAEVALHWASVPEPATICLLTAGIMLVAGRRTRAAGPPRPC
jgi:hypothetical protein